MDFSAENNSGGDGENAVELVKVYLNQKSCYHKVLQENNSEECQWDSIESFKGEVVGSKTSQEKTCYISGKMVIVQKLHA